MPKYLLYLLVTANLLVSISYVNIGRYPLAVMYILYALCQLLMVYV